MTHETLTAEECAVLTSRLANGLHVADIDVHWLLATVAALRAKVESQDARLDYLSASWTIALDAAEAKAARYREALETIKQGPFGDGKAVYNHEDVRVIVSVALADSATPGEGKT